MRGYADLATKAVRNRRPPACGLLDRPRASHMMQDMKPFPGTLGAAVLLVSGVLGGVLGCQAPRPISGDVQVRLANEDAYRQFWFHSISAVRHFGYELDRADPAAGIITSAPLTSKQWFEFWRNDTLGAGQVLEASLQTIRRQVRVEVQPVTGEKGEYQANVQVYVQRFSQLERQITTPSSAAQAFGKLPTIQPAGSPAQAAPYWIDLGRDHILENAVLHRIGRYPDARIVAATEKEAASASEPGTQPVEDEDSN